MLSVILVARNRAVIVKEMEHVVTQQNTVLVHSVQITDVYTESGKNQEGKRSGDMMESVV